MSASDMNLPHGYTAGTAIGNRLIVVGGDINTGDNTVETARVSTTGCVTPTATVTPVSCVLGFAPATNFPVGTGPRSVAAGDFNRDNNPDLVIANAGSDNVSVLLGNGFAGFGTATNFPVGVSPVSVAVGDFNRDSN